jgi:hypothetical protein
MAGNPEKNDGYAGSAKAFLKKAQVCEESNSYWHETLVFLREQVSYFKEMTRRNGEMRPRFPPDYIVVAEFIEEFNDFISVLECLNDCILIKNLIHIKAWKHLSLGIEKKEEYWTTKIEGRLIEYLEKRHLGRSVREHYRLDAIVAIHGFSKSMERTIRELL